VSAKHCVGFALSHSHAFLGQSFLPHELPDVNGLVMVFGAILEVAAGIPALRENQAHPRFCMGDVEVEVVEGNLFGLWAAEEDHLPGNILPFWFWLNLSLYEVFRETVSIGCLVVYFPDSFLFLEDGSPL
jgi:hypothetical protein